MSVPKVHKQPKPNVGVRGSTWLTNFANCLSGAAQMYTDSCCEKLALAVLGSPGRGSQVG